MTASIIYRRVSTAKQERSGLGLEAQLESCERLAVQRGWETIAVFTDADVGGAIPLQDRPAGRQAATLARETGGVVVVATLDRIGRDTEEYLRLLREAAKDGWRIESPDMSGIDSSTPEGKFIHSVRMSAAEYEKALIGIRTSAALRAKLRRGERVGMPPMVTAAAISRAKELRAEGLSYPASAAALDAEGCPPPKSGAWNRKTISHMVTGEPWGKVSRDMRKEGAA